MIKKAYIFILKSFAGPFIMTFFIALFILLMQFVWLYIDDMLGKGLEWYVIAELLFYSCANLVPLALPLAILLSSLMTFGNLGEHYELVAFKSAGISIQKVMKPLILLIVFVSIGAFFFSNYIIPSANLKFYSLLYDIRKKKPAIDIKPNVYYNEIPGFIIRIKDKVPSPKGEMMKNIMIYDHSQDNGNRQVTIADSGIMKLTPNNHYLQLQLFHGADYREDEENTLDKKYPFSRFSFEENSVLFDITEFQLNRTEEDAFKDDYRMLNIAELNQKIDTFNQDSADKVLALATYEKEMREGIDSLNNQFYKNSRTFPLYEYSVDLDKYLSYLTSEKRSQVYSHAINLSRNVKWKANGVSVELKSGTDQIIRHNIEWHRKFTLAAACLIMFLIGAPLGAIVKKGGLGMPVIISVIFFLIFWVMTISGEKMCKEMVLQPIEGMWLSSIVLLPIGIFFMYKATTDSALFNWESYKIFFSKFFKRKSN